MDLLKKKFLFIGLLLLSLSNAHSQAVSSSPDFINLRTTMGGQLLRYVNYFKAEGKYYLKITDANDSTPIVKEVKEVDLFKKIKKNKKILLQFLNRIHNQKHIFLITKEDYYNPNIQTKQLGIKYGVILYNHFPHFSDEDLNNKALSKYLKGMLLINELYTDLERLSSSN